MNSTSSQPRTDGNDSRWPKAEMLTRGTFGTGTPSEKRIIALNKAICAVMVIWAVTATATHAYRLPIVRAITYLMPGALCSYYALEKRKYFLTLDELTQRIELQGMAWAYSLGVLGALWVGGICYAVSQYLQLNSKWLPWLPLFLLAAFLATVKGVYRYFATRRY